MKLLSPRRTWSILKKELIQLKRDRSTFAMILMIPVVQLLLFGYAINNDPKHLRTAVLIRDNSIFSRSIVSALHHSEYFDVVLETGSEKQAKQWLQQGEVSFVLTIPENFSRDLVKGVRPQFLIEADSSDPTATGNAVGIIPEAVESALRRDLTGPLAALAPTPLPVDVAIHRLYNPEGFTRYNIIPGLIAMILMMTGIMMTALSLTRERERGTMENMLAMPVKPLEVMIGKVLPYMLIGFFQSGIILLTARFLFHIPVLGNLLVLLVALLMFITCNLAIGFAISSAARNQLQALQMTIMVFLPSIMLSGFVFPFQGMPTWARHLGGCIPMTYFLRIVRGVLLKGNGWLESFPNLWPMMIFLVIITALAMKVYRRTLD